MTGLSERTDKIDECSIHYMLGDDILERTIE